MITALAVRDSAGLRAGEECNLAGLMCVCWRPLQSEGFRCPPVLWLMVCLHSDLINIFWEPAVCLAILPILSHIIQEAHEAETVIWGSEKKSDLSQFTQLVIRERLRLWPWPTSRLRGRLLSRGPWPVGNFSLSSRCWLSRGFRLPHIRLNTTSFFKGKHIMAPNSTSPSAHFGWSFKFRYLSFVVWTLPWPGPLSSKMVAGRWCSKWQPCPGNFLPEGRWGSSGRTPRVSCRA